MENNNLHHLVLKQLKRTNINIDELKSDKEKKWYSFIERVSRTYFNEEQDRYLLERSLTISSNEMKAINEKLEYIQKLARLGYWFYDRKNDQLFLSKEMSFFAGLNLVDGIHSLQEFISFIHRDFRSKFSKALNKVFLTELPSEIEIKFKNKIENKFLWYYIKIYPDFSFTDKGLQFVSAIVFDINQRKKDEEKLEQAHQQLMALSRQAGKIDVATSILHNIGNILNSVNVSLSILKENLGENYPDKLMSIAKMIHDNLTNLPFYFTQDTKGKLIPRYIMEFAEVFYKIHQKSRFELNNVIESIIHIKEITEMQNFFGPSISEINNKIYVPELIENALKMTVGLKKQALELQKEYEKTPILNTCKSKLLQIIINLVQNACDSVYKKPNQDVKKITIHVKNNPKNIQIMVKDNGIGIAAENIDRIFAFGYTTKEGGHGFGLHSSAITAKELQGSLKAISEGLNQGATFILTLPKLGNH